MILKIENLKKNYHQGLTNIEVLKSINLEVKKGETIAIVGASGSGKSTLLSLIAGFDNPTSGYVQILNNKLSELKEDELTLFRGQNMGFIFQQFHLMPTLTALENVSLPLEIQKRDQAQAMALEALKAVGLAHRMTHFPHEMSGGECQRVAIARASVIRPQILLADEPSGNLDESTGQNVMQNLFDLVTAEQMTMLLVTHSAELAKRCHRCLELVNGQLQEMI